MARLQEKYIKEIAPKIQKEFKVGNMLALPCLEKIVISMGVNGAVKEQKVMEEALRDLTAIAGQKAVATVARKAISNFKLREGMKIGAKVTLRGKRMYEFLDRLISLAMPKIKDFRGMSDKAFDDAGNYSLGLTEQSIFPEVNLDRVHYTQGMNVTLVFRNSSQEKSKFLLREFGFPFVRREKTQLQEN